VAWNRSFEMGFEWAAAKAEANGDAEILEQLHAIEPFDPVDETDLGVLGEAIEYSRGCDYHTPGLWDEILEYAINGESPYYTMEQVHSYIPDLELSSAAIERVDFLSAYDLFMSYPVSDIPVHFITGTEDHKTTGMLAFEYYEAFEAPAKSFTWIEGAAHMVMMDQTDAWTDAMVAIKARIWLQEPATGKSNFKLFWWLIPAFLVYALFEGPPIALIIGESILIPFPWISSLPFLKLQSLLVPELVGAWWLIPVALVSCLFNYLLGEELLFRGILLPEMRGVFWPLGFLSQCGPLCDLPSALPNPHVGDHPWCRSLDTAIPPMPQHLVQHHIVQF
jgi:hypothetical protein